jgi:hypothetical protein
VAKVLKGQDPLRVLWSGRQVRHHTLRRIPRRMLRKVRHPNLWVPRRDLLLPRRQFRAPRFQPTR